MPHFCRLTVGFRVPADPWGSNTGVRAEISPPTYLHPSAMLGSKLRKEQHKRHRVYTGSGHHCGVIPYSSVWCVDCLLGWWLRESWIRGCSGSRTIPSAGLLDYEDTRLKTSSHVRMGLSLAWKASLAMRIFKISYHCNRLCVTLTLSGVYINRRVVVRRQSTPYTTIIP